MSSGHYRSELARQYTSLVTTSIAYPHDPLREILPGVWFIHGRMRMGPGMTINRNMIVVESDGDLTLLNPIRLTTAGEQALEELGTVRHAVRLGVFHGVDDAYTVGRFGARFWCQEGSDQKPIPEPYTALREDGELPIPGASLFVYREAAQPECCLLIDRGSGLLVSCDSIQHWESSSNCSLPAKLLTRLMGFMHTANIGPPWKKRMTREGGSLRPDFERLLELPFDNLVGAHGQPLLGGAREALRATVKRVFD